MTQFWEWLITLVAKVVLGRVVNDVVTPAIDKARDTETSRTNAAKVRESLKKIGASDAEIEKAMLDLTNGNS